MDRREGFRERDDTVNNLVNDPGHGGKASEYSPDRQDLAWVEVKREHLIRDRYIDFRSSAYRFPDGKVFAPFYTYSRKDYVVIVAEDCQGRLICVRQFRQGIRQVTTEFPAGGLERSDGKEYRSEDMGPSLPECGRNGAENALSAAKRELLEETGYCSEEWTHLLTIPSNATIADNYAHIYLAERCRKAGEQDLDETEFLNVELHPAEEIDALIRTGRFQQAVHVMAWLMVKERRRFS